MGITQEQREKAGREMAERVCHDEQLLIWSGEMVSDLIDHLKEPSDYDSVVDLHNDMKAAIKSLIEKAFTHPENTSS